MICGMMEHLTGKGCFCGMGASGGRCRTLPSASQTPPLGGEALLYCPSKAPIVEEPVAQHLQKDFHCSFYCNQNTHEFTL